jgi:SAM-dependent methyltransferase
LIYIKKQCPDISIVGVEPVGKLRDIGYSKGILKTELIEGDATSLQFQDGEFDLVCAFGVLHHIKYPQQAVSEMLRVSKKAIFISDSNNFGQGPGLIRLTKQIINLLRLWKFVDFIKTKGRGYALSEGDGLAYSYSVFNNYSQIRHKCKSVHISNTVDAKINPYRTSSHVALLGIKQP